MSGRTLPKLQLPVVDINRRRTLSISEGWHNQSIEIAGPFFDAGGDMICMAEIPDYKGGVHLNLNHRFDLLIQGRMKFRLGNETVIAEPGDLVCTPAGTMTQRTGLEPIVWIYIVMNDTPFWKPLIKSGPTIRPYESADMMYIMVKRILEAHRSQDLYSIRSANEYSGMLVTLLQRELRHYDEDWQSNRVDNLIDLVDRIRKNPAFGWTRTSLAQEAGMSERNLTDVFNRVFGVSPGQMIKKVRMEHALYLLREGEDTIESIGKAVGYGSAIAFTNAFKNYMGISPGKYREMEKERKMERWNNGMGE